MTDWNNKEEVLEAVREDGWNNKEEVLITAITDSQNSFPRYFYWLQTSATDISPLLLLA